MHNLIWKWFFSVFFFLSCCYLDKCQCLMFLIFFCWFNSTLDKYRCTIVQHHLKAVAVTVDFPNCHHFLFQNVASDPLVDPTLQIYVYRLLLKCDILVEEKKEEKLIRIGVSSNSIKVCWGLSSNCSASKYCESFEKNFRWGSFTHEVTMMLFWGGKGEKRLK